MVYLTIYYSYAKLKLASQTEQYSIHKPISYIVTYIN